MAVSISMNIRQNSQSIENNTSNVTVEVYAWWTNGSYNAQTAPDGYPQARGTVTIDDVAYAFYSKFNTGHTTSGYGLIFTKTLDIPHNNEGEKVLSCWASYATGVSSGTVSTSGSLALPTIPRKSVVKATDGILGVEQVLKVERKSSLLTHTITYQCGTESGVLCEKSSETDIVWTPPISLAAQYPSSVSILLVFTVITYHDDKEIGSSAVTVTYTIPESVKPAVSLEVSDMMGYFSQYGAYVQKKSRLRIAVTASESQGARITAYRIEADGKTYTNSLVITEPVSDSGDLTVKATVTDTRGRTETANVVIPVMVYTPPNVSTVAVDRTDEKGNVSSSGGYLTVRFHAAITGLSGKNSAVYTLQYKKANEAYYFSHSLNDYSGSHTVNDGVFTFAAETASSYNIIVTASDDFESGSKTGVGSSIKKTWSMRKDGVGFAFGKIAEKANTLDMGWDIELNENDVLRNGLVAYAPNGFGLGTIAKLLTEADDLDEIWQSGNYQWMDSTPKNAYVFPGTSIGEHGYMRVDNKDNGAFSQTLRCTYGTIGFTVERHKRGSIITPWKRCDPDAFAPAGYGYGGTMPIIIINNDTDGSAFNAALDAFLVEMDGQSVKQAIICDYPYLSGCYFVATIYKLNDDHATVSAYSYSREEYRKVKSGGVWLGWVDVSPSAYAPAKVLLYENASPSSTFAQQTFDWGAKGYSHFLVEFTNGAHCAKFRTGVGYSNMFTVQDGDGSNPVSVRERKVYVSTQGITIYDCYVKFVSSTQAHLNNDLMIPYRIYGIKE